MQRRLARLLAADTTWLELGLMLITLAWGLDLGLHPALYDTAFAPIAAVVPAPIAAGGAGALACLKAGAIWRKLGPAGGHFGARLAVWAAGGLFWTLVAVTVVVEGAPLFTFWYITLVLLHVLLLYRLWLDILTRRGDPGHADQP